MGRLKQREFQRGLEIKREESFVISQEIEVDGLDGEERVNEVLVKRERSQELIRDLLSEDDVREVVERSFFLGNFLPFGIQLRGTRVLEVFDEKLDGLGAGLDEVNGVEVFELLPSAVYSFNAQNATLNQVNHGQEMVYYFVGLLVDYQQRVLLHAAHYAVRTFVEQIHEEIPQIGSDVEVDLFGFNHYIPKISF